MLAAVAAAPPGMALAACPDPFAGGRQLGTLPLTGAGGGPRPFHERYGTGLDARLVTDLSQLAPDRLVIPAGRFFIRTAAPAGLPSPADWTIRVTGLVERPLTLSTRDLAPLVEPAGEVLIECAGNNNPWNFGLMSAARWGGVRLASILERVNPRREGTRVLVSGLDPPSGEPAPRASWIFALDDLAAAGAFLATEMNGQPLPADHGRPVRLVVPGWYGCACIKWVDEIRLVDDEEPATDQMREYASRTHQQGIPALARDYAPAAIDVAAMPVRIEKWRLDGQIAYRVVGILWGGSRPTDRLTIRFNSGEPFLPVDVCPPPETTRTWSVWSHLWRPRTPGRYSIVMGVDDPGVRTRRLDLFFYARQVWVDEV